ncbi:MAG: hypothetical protein ACOC2A_02015 [Halanaeroarchaeum sp.]
MERYRKQVLKGSAVTFLGATIAAAISVAVPTPRATLVPLTGSSLVLIGTYYLLGEREWLSVAWPAPLIAAGVVVLSPDVLALQSASLTLAVLSILSALTWRVPAYFAKKGQELGDRD